MSERVDVRKTYKLFIGGEFVRSESGRSYEVADQNGGSLANAARASRKDVRDAVVAARKAQPGWAGATASNRGQVLYRIAEMMESRRTQFVEEVVRAEGADEQTGEAIDTLVWYAGLTDKLMQIVGNMNPVAGPYFNITTPEPTGVVAIVAPERRSLAGFVERIAAASCGGNAVIVLASEAHPLPAMTFAECVATADVPPGVLNILTGSRAELISVIAAHGDIDAIDVTGVPEALLTETERSAAGNVKRVIRRITPRTPYEAAAFMEMKTVWHPKGT